MSPPHQLRRKSPLGFLFVVTAACLGNAILQVESAFQPIGNNNNFALRIRSMQHKSSLASSYSLGKPQSFLLRMAADDTISKSTQDNNDNDNDSNDNNDEETTPEFPASSSNPILTTLNELRSCQVGSLETVSFGDKIISVGQITLDDVLPNNDDDENPFVLSCLSHFGDFNAWEMTQQYIAAIDSGLIGTETPIILVGIGSIEAAQKFSSDLGLHRYTDMIQLVADEGGVVSKKLGCYEGWLKLDQVHEQRWEQTKINPYVRLFGMIFGFGSPGTIKEVVYGYIGDYSGKHGEFGRKWAVDALLYGSVQGRFPALTEKAFEDIPEDSSLRPFELATLRLQTGLHIVANWGKLGPKNGDLFTQMGGTFVFHGTQCIWHHFDTGILAYAKVPYVCKVLEESTGTPAPRAFVPSPLPPHVEVADSEEPAPSQTDTSGSDDVAPGTSSATSSTEVDESTQVEDDPYSVASKFNEGSLEGTSLEDRYEKTSAFFMKEGATSAKEEEEQDTETQDPESLQATEEPLEPEIDPYRIISVSQQMASSSEAATAASIASNDKEEVPATFFADPQPVDECDDATEDASSVQGDDVDIPVAVGDDVVSNDAMEPGAEADPSLAIEKAKEAELNQRNLLQAQLLMNQKSRAFKAEPPAATEEPESSTPATPEVSDDAIETEANPSLAIEKARKAELNQRNLLQAQLLMNEKSRSSKTESSTAIEDHELPTPETTEVPSDATEAEAEADPSLALEKAKEAELKQRNLLQAQLLMNQKSRAFNAELSTATKQPESSTPTTPEVANGTTEDAPTVQGDDVVDIPVAVGNDVVSSKEAESEVKQMPRRRKRKRKKKN